jgi:hypothetical protein
VTLNGEHPAVPAGSFHWSRIPEFRTARFYFGRNHDYVSGELLYDHRTRLVRELHFIKPDLLLLIDTLLGRGVKEIAARFPLAPGKWRLCEDGCWQEETEHACGLVPLGPFSAVMEKAWFSSCYGRKAPSSQLVLRGRINLPVQAGVLIDLAGRGPQGVPRLEVRGRSFRFSYADRCWLGFGVRLPGFPSAPEFLEAGCAAGLLVREGCEAFTVLETHGEGSVLLREPSSGQMG